MSKTPKMGCKRLALLLFAGMLAFPALAQARPKADPPWLSVPDSGPEREDQPWLERLLVKARKSARQRAIEDAEERADPTRHVEFEDPHHSSYLLRRPTLAVVDGDAKASIAQGDIAGAIADGSLAVTLIVDIKRDAPRRDGSRPYKVVPGLGVGRLGVKVRTEF